MVEPARLDGRFGMVVDGLGLLLQPGQHAEYLPELRLFPIPKVAARLRGAAQVRGMPVLVFDAGQKTPSRLPSVQTCPVVFLGSTGGGVGLLVAEPPQLLDSLTQADDVERPQLPFADALGKAYRGRVVGADPLTSVTDSIWWDADYDRLLGALAHG